MRIAENVEKLNAIVAADRSHLSDESRSLIEQLCRHFLDDPAQVDPSVLSLSRDTRSVLLQYGGLCAVEAIRENSRDRLTGGLTALVIENGTLDIRDTVRALAKFFHSASLLGVDTAELFDQFARRCRSETLGHRFREFSVPAWTRSASLCNFGLRAFGNGKSFSYGEDRNLSKSLGMYVAAPGLSFSQRSDLS